MKIKLPRKRSKLEAEFRLKWRAIQGAPLVEEHAFAPGRRWRFDFACPEAKIAIELHGGIWSGGRHTRGAGFAKDCEKFTEAALCGWRVIPIPTGGITWDLLGRIDKAVREAMA